MLSEYLLRVDALGVRATEETWPLRKALAEAWKERDEARRLAEGWRDRWARVALDDRHSANPEVPRLPWEGS